MAPELRDPQPTCVIVDDHQAVLDSVAAYLESEGFDVVGLATNAADAVRLLGKLKPDVVILDYRLPDSSGLQVARALPVAAPRTVAVLFSGDATRVVVAEALESGIRGVVLKESGATTLLRAINAVLDGRRYIDPRLRRRK
jgi:DNA-binding NarL/FixJ family response regulator